MRYRRLGNTLGVSVVGLGTWQLGGEWGRQFTQPEVDALVGRAGVLDGDRASERGARHGAARFARSAQSQ
jgi:hypothetical protein